MRVIKSKVIVWGVVVFLSSLFVVMLNNIYLNKFWFENVHGSKIELNGIQFVLSEEWVPVVNTATNIKLNIMNIFTDSKYEDIQTVKYKSTLCEEDKVCEISVDFLGNEYHMETIENTISREYAWGRAYYLKSITYEGVDKHVFYAEGNNLLITVTDPDFLSDVISINKV